MMGSLGKIEDDGNENLVEKCKFTSLWSYKFIPTSESKLNSNSLGMTLVWAMPVEH